MPNPISKTLPTPREIVAYLDRFVYGQHQAKRDLAVAVYNHYLGLGYRDGFTGADDAPPAGAASAFGRQHILLMGPTGSGKTYLIRLIAELLGVPWVFVAATSLVQTGYVGTRIENVIGTLYQKCGRDRRLAERGIVLIDEIDKIAAHDGASGPDVSGEGVQQSLLSVLDGRVVQTSTGGSADYVLGEVDTATVLFVCAGAFVGLDEQARLRRWEREGFPVPSGGGRRPGAIVGDTTTSFPDDLPDTEDLVAWGFIPEFVGRFATISATRALTADDLVSVLANAEDSALPRQQRLFAVHGIDLDFTPGALRAVAEEACALGTGARGLNRVVLRSLADVGYKLPELAAEGVTQVTVTAEVVRGYRPAGLRREPGRGRLARGARRAARAAAAVEDPRHAPVPRRHPIAADRLRALALRATVDEAPPAAETLDRDGFTDAAGLTAPQIRSRINALLPKIGYARASTGARRWWDEFDAMNRERLHVVLRVAEELRRRGVGLVEFHHAAIGSGTDNIRAVLHYLDYELSKREAEKDRKEADGE
jgi:ATP-dependent Clp protease ATP-binding subunit ClpX